MWFIWTIVESIYSSRDVWDIFWFTSENVRALNPQSGLLASNIRKCMSCDVSTSSVMIYYVCSYCPSGMSKKFFMVDTLGFSLFTRLKTSDFMYSTFFEQENHDGSLWPLRHRNVSHFRLKLFVQPKKMCFVFVYAHACSIYRFLSVIQLQNQCSPFSM